MRRFARTTALLTALLALASLQAGLADPPAGAQPAETQGGMMSSLRQAFGENLDRDQVRGHFDVGSPPNSRRYYCLVDPKTGKREPNGVSGETVQRRDGTTGVKSAVVSPLSCPDAEQKGMLVTTDYKLTGKAAAPANSPPPAAQAAPAPAGAAPVARPTPPLATAAPVAPAPLASPAAVASGTASDDPERREVMGVYARFILAQNTHDAAALSDVLLDSKDFVWAEDGGKLIWGFAEALAAFEQSWRGTWRLDPQREGSRVAAPSPDLRVVTAPLLVTSGEAAGRSSTRLVRWGGVFVQTPSGWRIASIFVTPLQR
jgi:hypothetical protein